MVDNVDNGDTRSILAIMLALFDHMLIKSLNL